ncbi:hypothetical protein [Pseudomonas sp. Hp2]|uniref:hypothetical protein n=1 Tax=Pseudomonas sp. Hp2 TaxID=701189 RepID=UPI0015AD87A4|nr:hypothetical protein [Pseudomonas sp. Hp2]
MTEIEKALEVLEHRKGHIPHEVQDAIQTVCAALREAKHADEPQSPAHDEPLQPQINALQFRKRSGSAGAATACRSSAITLAAMLRSPRPGLRRAWRMNAGATSSTARLIDTMFRDTPTMHRPAVSTRPGLSTC